MRIDPTSAAGPRLGRPLRWTRALSVLLLTGFAAVLASLLAGSAQAEPPMRLPTQIYDPADVLSNSERAALEERVDTLFDEHRVQLWVTFVNDFGGRSAESWTEQTITASGLGDRDVILAVATDEREFFFRPALGYFDGLSASEFQKVSDDNVLPALRDLDWNQAALGAADGISAALSGSNSGLIAAGVVGGLVVVGGGGGYLYSRRRRRRDIEDGVEAMKQEEALTAEQLARAPLDVLDPWSREILTDTDNAIRISEDEVALAVGEFGTAATAPFTKALADAKQALATSFALRQRLDDDIPETPQEQRLMLVEIITACTDADADLDEQVAAFDEMRNLLINAPDRLDELTRQVVSLSTRQATAQQTLDRLLTTYGADTLSSIADNPAMAADEIEFAESSIDQGRASAAKPVGQQGQTVAAIRSAEGAIDHAAKLLGAIENAEANIGAAHTQMPALIAEVEEELAEAGTLSADGGGALATAVAQAQEALTAARTGFEADPLGTFSALVDADSDLDDALDAARATSVERRRRTEMLSAAITSATAKVGAASDFIETRRGAIGSTARTRLSEAQRLLAEAQAAGTTDAARAVESARRAGALADQALMAAQGDVVQWQQHNAPRRQQSSGSVAGAVIGGILVDSFLRGTVGGSSRRGGFGGGFGGGGYGRGGRSPGSFGGSSSSGRIGTGGRF